MRALDWDALQALIKTAGLLRIPRHLALLRDLVRRAQADWPALLADAPSTLQRTVQARLAGGVALTHP